MSEKNNKVSYKKKNLQIIIPKYTLRNKHKEFTIYKKNKVISFLDSIRFYGRFDSYDDSNSVSNSVNLLCYSCFKEFKDKDINICVYRKVNDENICDLPMCPNPECEAFCVVNFNKIPGKNIYNKRIMLNFIKKILKKN